MILLLSSDLLVKEKRIHSNQCKERERKKRFIMDYSLLTEVFGWMMEKALYSLSLQEFLPDHAI